MRGVLTLVHCDLVKIKACGSFETVQIGTFESTRSLEDWRQGPVPNISLTKVREQYASFLAGPCITLTAPKCAESLKAHYRMLKFCIDSDANVD